jgi:multidrug efflux system outer membrane protein
MLPTIGEKFTHDNSRLSMNSANSFGAISRKSVNNYISTTGMSYEIDFFGKYRRADEAARANLLSSKAAKETVVLAITAEVAKTYFALRALDAKLAIARRTLKTRQESCGMYRSRFNHGYCTELDYLRIVADAESVKATVLDLESAAERAENALGVLIGASPRNIVSRRIDRGSSIESLRVPSNIPQGLPSDLVFRRPDVAQAEGQLIAANAKIGEAIAAHFPSISLTGYYGFESKSLTNLFDHGSDMWALSSGISFPIFSGGRIYANQKMAEARYRRMLAAYEKSIQMAFRETLDALIVIRKNKSIVISRTAQVNALKKSYSLATVQKESGLIGLLDLLDVERGLLAAEMDLVGALQNQLNSVVDFCKALGGGWNYEKLRR